MDGHKKIREITGDSAQLKEDYLEEDQAAFLVLAKYSNAAFSLLPVLGILSQSRNSGRIAQHPTWLLLMGSLWHRIHVRLGSSASQENGFIQSNESDSGALFLCQTWFTSHTSCSRQSPTHSSVLWHSSYLSIDLGRSRQHQKSVKIELLKDIPPLTLQMWLQGLSGSCSKHPEHKEAALAEPQQHRNWEHILPLWHVLWQGILLHPHSCHTTILREQHPELSLHLLQFPVARTAFESSPIKRILRRQPLEVSRAQERFGDMRATSAHGPLAATPSPRHDVSGLRVPSSSCPMWNSALLLHHFWPLEIPIFEGVAARPHLFGISGTQAVFSCQQHLECSHHPPRTDAEPLETSSSSLPLSPSSFMPQGITCSQGNHTSISSDCFPWKDDFFMLYNTVLPSRGITSRSFPSSLFHLAPSSRGFPSDSWFQGCFSLTSTKWLLNKTEKLHLSKKTSCLDTGLHSQESKAS